MNSKLYDWLKAIAQIWLPALGTLVFTSTGIWSLMWGEQAVGTIMGLDMFLGIVLVISSRNYSRNEKNFDGKFIVNLKDPRKEVYTLDMSAPLEDIPTKKTILLKVTPS